ncbi:MAG: FkbM family methyltransferase [Aquaticitalea sp.]
MALKHTIDFILNHPLNKNQRGWAVWRFLKWQLKSRLFSGASVARFGEKSKIIVKRGLSGATGNLYSGLHEFEEMSFLLHFLRNTDFFVDLGANVGSYTILASNERGANTLSIEPIPEAFQILEQNIALNNISSLVSSMNIGMGNKKETLKFTKSLDARNHVAKEYDTDTVDVTMQKFDDVKSLDKPTLIKMDVEGYESEVLKGMEITLSNKYLKAMIIELNSSGRRYGFDEHLTHQSLTESGFLPYAYNPHQRSLTKLEKNGLYNTIYIRDFDFVNDRLKSAKPYQIRGQKI